MTDALRPANVHFNDQGTPIADAFDDVYFSNDSGIQETQHVFIQGNNIVERWLTCSQSHYVIAETGFGTGLNCLVAMLAFAQFRDMNPGHPLKRLYILSTEKFPIEPADLTRALSVFPDVAPLVETLVKQYPPMLNGCHRLQFDRWHTHVDLWLGDVHDLLPTWHCPADGLVDSWFLDGFAPSKNPDMWTDALFTQMARLSKPGAGFATFTAAGVVKRGLKEAGFCIEKRKGFGRKRDMLTGTLTEVPQARTQQPWHYRYPNRPITSTETIAIIGAGLAGSSVALALCQRGIRVTLFGCASEPADGASGNRQGGFYPQLQASLSPSARIQAHSFLYAARYYQHLVEQGASFTQSQCGVLLLAFSDEIASRQHKLVNNQLWPKQIVYPVTREEATEIANLPMQHGGLFCPLGGWISPQELVHAQLALARQTGLLTEHYSGEVDVTHHEGSALVTARQSNQQWHFSRAVLACGHHSAQLNPLSYIPLRPVRGQVEAIPEQAPLDSLSTVLCHKGYMTPGWQGRMALGSTYVKLDTQCDARPEESEQNLATHANAMTGHEWAQHIAHDNTARASIRMGVADHQPVVGAVMSPAILSERYEQLYKGLRPADYSLNTSDQVVTVLTGLGSRGLTTAPLMAEVLVSQWCGEPLPMEEDLLQALAPERFVLREMKKKPQ
ncbi:bifunctional tRNA (5-methylaminomethyl-2-thiouridine)(34)-methyltransferase MnmD/FAD-dependent 5-carboxymethylaminomethyl-2-thiouridine(34) oxidoreductase MnmC [Aestuariibacter sp. GS-14]|uniref:bifunctional tRNA (5-methylaminomethyl-2-thiouridine)(34)-methyltransferase MnmD/FAD-dependent 5-carboxymethylaminomethyl-2-thiouridine(34) oxidoreductase MnmC n=1 Tax=Aestuariibacter sp. GS-14 TaxID=2590670 RepID=UPI001126FE69|nr:bifunctional tRNA (5-methylaminomethyl-2-thiouridine)(34)-methyltransferase MnmD/FAD-dependent 5-carboxymethylaminomethyl-2-thiouridine(34) oxidoreductase MnmC [Aestuariibacter sp. GS-14]TPV60729.1 bifunctional tRNA (5-methylaminomethyl-2-thiouridine)(34)-methyltransferase MnmD/FAD-dependent 5-carboxymethylaminomethyl-2-thiouridine(34) oxidoreductase MnmC [Aestuariibacter sp. GS-14]